MAEKDERERTAIELAFVRLAPAGFSSMEIEGRFTMKYVDPHIHMVSRVTDDYKRMALAGCVFVSEPAFWAGFDRSGVLGFRDYFRQLTEYEPKRAALYGIEHYCWLCINAKEAENVALSREVIAMIPEFLHREGCWGSAKSV